MKLRNVDVLPRASQTSLADCRGPTLYHLTALLPNHELHPESSPKQLKRFASLTRKQGGPWADLSPTNKTRKQQRASILLKLIWAQVFRASARTSLLGTQRRLNTASTTKSPRRYPGKGREGKGAVRKVLGPQLSSCPQASLPASTSH